MLHGVDWRKKNMGLNTEAGLLRQPLSWGHPPCKEQPLEGVISPLLLATIVQQTNKCTKIYCTEWITPPPLVH